MLPDMAYASREYTTQSVEPQRWKPPKPSPHDIKCAVECAAAVGACIYTLDPVACLTAMNMSKCNDCIK